MSSKMIKYLLVTLALTVGVSVTAYSKVVVIPLPADSVNKGLVPIAVGSIDSGGSISHATGVSSVTNPQTGEYVITLTGQVALDNPIVILTPFTSGFGVPEIIGYQNISTSSFRVYIQEADGTARDSAFSFAVYHIESE